MKVFLSESAGEQLYQLIEYLENKWSPKIADNFIIKLDRSLETIGKLPYGFPQSEKFPGIRKCVITPQTSIFYRINDENQEVEIIGVIDNRMEY